MREFGVSDHFHTKYNLCDIQSARNDFLAYDRPPNFHFGIELSCMTKWECAKIARGDYRICREHLDDPVYGLNYHAVDDDAELSPCIDFTAEDKKRLGIEYVIAGVHWPLNRWVDDPEQLLEDVFQQHIYLVEHPLVDILAHPWDSLECMVRWRDWIGATGKGRFKLENRDFAVFDHLEEKNRRLMEAVLAQGKAVELNLSTLMLSRRPEDVFKACWRTMAEWREAGVKFVLGTDQHEAHHNTEAMLAAEQLLDSYGFREEHIRYLWPE